MIKEKKNPIAPLSLSTTKNYDGEDVKRQLLDDQHHKCYICERYLGTDFQIEHFKSRNNYPKLIQDWNNLLMSCSYCNGKKSNSFDNNVNPLSVNVEEEIEQRINLLNNKAEFKVRVNDASHNETAKMLNILYNGNEKIKIRKIKEECFFNNAMQLMNRFSRIINDFIMNPTSQNRSLVACELSIDKELLGFKYWMIHDNHLEKEFKDEIVWNK